MGAGHLANPSTQLPTQLPASMVANAMIMPSSNSDATLCRMQLANTANATKSNRAA